MQAQTDAKIRLIQFLSAWLEWANRNQGTTFERSANWVAHVGKYAPGQSAEFGLCANLDNWAKAKGWPVDEIYVLSVHFKKALLNRFGDCYSPFNRGPRGENQNYWTESRQARCHLNQKRLEWVRQYLFDNDKITAQCVEAGYHCGESLDEVIASLYAHGIVHHSREHVETMRVNWAKNEEAFTESLNLAGL